MAEKTYIGIEPQVIPPLETTLARMSHHSIWSIPCPRFKQWTADETGLEFTLGVTIPCMPPNFICGPYNYEDERVEMVRCVTADLLHDKYMVDITVGDVYQPADNWWLLVTAETTNAIVKPHDLRLCHGNLRTLTDPEHVLCFQLFDFYRRKLDFRYGLR